MSGEPSFADFIRRIRAGDAQAAAELVRRYEPVIRLEVRLHLSDPRLRRLFDSMDICQSVLASFFVRAALGEYRVDRPQDLLNLLVAMARNKLAFQVRKHRTRRRDYHRLETIAAEEWQLITADPGPSRQVEGADLVHAVRCRLTDEERRLADLRSQDRTWADIAAELGGTAQARRKQLERAVDRVLHQLGLDEANDE